MNAFSSTQRDLFCPLNVCFAFTHLYEDMNTIRTLLLTAILACMSVSAFAASDIFIKATGLKGEQKILPMRKGGKPGQYCSPESLTLKPGAVSFTLCDAKGNPLTGNTNVQGGVLLLNVTPVNAAPSTSAAKIQATSSTITSSATVAKSAPITMNTTCQSQGTYNVCMQVNGKDGKPRDMDASPMVSSAPKQ